MIRRTERFTFFFRPEAPFSQWYPARFELAGKLFSCAEQYMMYGKAILFGDTEVAAEILAAVAPKQHKALGRKVRNFSDVTWEANREVIVTACATSCSPRERGGHFWAGGWALSPPMLTNGTAPLPIICGSSPFHFSSARYWT
jgi:ADP-ribose binding protein with NADAR domain